MRKMIDNISIKCIVNREMILFDNDFAQLHKVTFAKERDKQNFDFIKYVTQKGNLHFSIIGDRLKVRNSICKFYKGNNYSNLTFLELRQAIKKIEYLTGIDASEFKIKSLEFAINISTEKPPKEYLKLFSLYKHREYDKMRSRTASWYGNKYNLSEFNIKTYDKGSQIKSEDRIDIGNVFRFEVQYKKQRLIHPAYQLSDLLVKDVVIEIYKDFIKKIKNLTCIDDESLYGLSSRERELFFAGKDPHFWGVESVLNRNTKKSKFRKYKKIIKEIPKVDLMEGFTKNIENSFNELIEN